MHLRFCARQMHDMYYANDTLMISIDWYSSWPMTSGMVEVNKNKKPKTKQESNLESTNCVLSIHNVGLCIFPFVTDQIIVLSSNKCKKKEYTSKIVTYLL